MADKRRYPRAPAQGIAAYVWLNEKLSSAIVENISAGGLFFRSPRPPELGTTVRVRLVQPGLKQAIEMTGTVVSTISPKDALAANQVPGAGVRFNKVPAAERERFDHLLAALGLPAVEAIQIAPAVLQVQPVAAPLSSSPPRSMSAPVQRASSAGLVDYQVHDASLRIEALPLSALTPVHDTPSIPRSVATVESLIPDPVEIQVEVKAPSRRRVDETERLMQHVKGLMKQLAEMEDVLRQRDLQIDLLRQELSQVRLDLETYQRRHGV
ncbi:MAG: PilZ domain-containing protein [Pseudomonadota bacterium]